MNPIVAQSSVHPAARLGSAAHLVDDDDVDRWPMPRTTFFVAAASLLLWVGIGYAIYKVI